jgi:DNA repair photolyase
MWVGKVRLVSGAAGQMGSGAVSVADGRKDSPAESERSAGPWRKSEAQLEFLPRRPAAPLPLLDERQRGTRFIEWEVRSVLNSPATTGMGFWSINPYVGCEFGCSYCYARETHRYAKERALASGPPSPFTERGTGGEVGGDLSAFESFEKEILVKTGTAEVLARTLDPAKLKGSSLVIGTATDPYQPAERKFGLTRQILQRLQFYRGLSIGIITKSPLVTRDLSLLQALSQVHEVNVNISLATVSANLARRLERRSPVPAARLRALRTLTKGGIHAGLLVAPILPGISDDRPGLAALFAAAKEAGAYYVHGSALRLDPVLAPRFIALVEEKFPHLAERYHSHFQNRYYVTREYQDALTRRLQSLQQEYGFAKTESRRIRQHRLPQTRPVEQASLL